MNNPLALPTANPREMVVRNPTAARWSLVSMLGEVVFVVLVTAAIVVWLVEGWPI